MGKRKIDIQRELAAMEKMTAGDLRAKYAESYGEASRSGNRQWLFRRCAWRLQSLAEGGLSERARRRAKEPARDADIRVIPPADLVLRHTRSAGCHGLLATRVRVQERTG